MDKKLQDLVWSILPKEFKEGIRAMYNRPILNDLDFGYKSALLNLFGHNLTSDAEGEELLTVSAITVREMYAANERIKNDASDNELGRTSDHINHVLRCLFGSKCLPDEEEPKPAGPKFEVGDKVRISCAFSSGEIWDSVLNGRVATIVGCYRESNNWIYCFKEPIRDFAEFWLEPCTEPGNYMGDANDRFNHMADVSKMMGYTIIDGIDETGRLHVAAMAMQGMLAAGEDYSGDCTFIVKKSFEIADALIAGCKKE